MKHCLVFFVTIGLFLTSCTSPVAEVEQFHPTITVNHNNETFEITHIENAYPGDELLTGPEGTGALMWKSTGDIFEISPNTFVKIKPDNIAMGSIPLAFAVEKGKITAVSQGNSNINIGTPYGVVQMLNVGKPIKFEMNLDDKYLAMKMGNVEFLGSEKQPFEVQTGKKIIFSMNKIQMIDDTDDALTKIEPILLLIKTAKIVKTPKQKKQGQNKWTTINRNDHFDSGDTIKTNAKSKILLSYGHGSKIYLKDDSVVTLQKISSTPPANKDGRHFAETLFDFEKGSLEIELDKGQFDHAVTMDSQQGSFTIKPGYRKAIITTVKMKKKSPFVRVFAGEVSLPDGTKIKAGQAGNVGTKNVINLKNELADQLIIIKAGNHIVHYPGAIPTLGIQWKEENEVDKQGIIEIAGNNNYENPFFIEKVSDHIVVLPDVPFGKIFWRCLDDKKQEIATGTCALIKEQGPSERLVRENVVRDTGEVTTIFYQLKLPRIEFRWKRVPKTVKYEIIVYEGKNLETPIGKKESQEPVIKFKRGFFKDSKYFWYVNAFDQNNKKLHTSPMNELHILNNKTDTELLEVHFPSHGAKLRGSKIKTVGIVKVRRSNFSINEKAVKTVKGKFETHLRLKKGLNALDYQLYVRGRSSYHHYYRQISVL